MTAAPRNSTELERRFPEVYRQFFSSQQQVASAPNNFYWAGEVSGLHGGPTLNQQLPFRLYAGLQTAVKPGFSLHPTYTAYDTLIDRFEERPLDAQLRTALEKYLTNKYPTQQGTIRFLCEVPFGFGMGANSAVAAAIALLLDPENARAAAHGIAAAPQHGVSSGSSVATVLHNEATPILHTQAGTQSLAVLSKTTASFLLPFDIALIYTGIPNYGESAIRASQATLGTLEEQSQQLREVIGQQGMPLTQQYIEALNGTTELLLLALLSLGRSGAQQAAYYQLAQSMNQFHTLLETIHPFHPQAKALRNTILNHPKFREGTLPVGIKVSGYGNGGVLLVVTPEGQCRDSIEDSVTHLQKESGQGYSLEYASWRDGFNTETAHVVQNTKAAQASSHLRGSLVSLAILKGKHKKKEVIPADGLKTFLEGNYFDIVADLTTNHMYVGGKPVKSTALPSQKGTAHILHLLTEQADFSVSSEAIAGSYGISRYDLQGKIIIPLRKVVEERLHHDLNLILRGSGQDFTVSLDPAGLSILIATGAE
jgi:mevalonate kinase